MKKRPIRLDDNVDVSVVKSTHEQIQDLIEEQRKAREEYECRSEEISKKIRDLKANCKHESGYCLNSMGDELCKTCFRILRIGTFHSRAVFNESLKGTYIS